MWAEKNKLLFSILVWEKPLSIINKNRFSQNIEYIIRIYDYGTGLNKLENNLYYNKVKKYSINNKIHPTQKPLDLIKELIELSSKENDIIFDGFLGSGTTAIACSDLNRKIIACELDKEYYDKAIQRIKNHTNQQKLF